MTIDAGAGGRTGKGAARYETLKNQDAVPQREERGVFVRRPWGNRLVLLPAFVVTAGVLTGCTPSGLRFTNVSDTWLNVSFYVAEAEDPSKEPKDLYLQDSLQVEPGDTATYRPDAFLMHIQVETVTPTWVPTGRRFWLELLTRDPMHIVASGRGDKLEFQSFRGEIALIPQREIDAGRFAYHTVVETPQPEQVTDATTDEPSWDD